MHSPYHVHDCTYSEGLSKRNMATKSRRTHGNVRPVDALLARFLLDCHRVLSREENKVHKKSDETVLKTLGGRAQTSIKGYDSRNGLRFAQPHGTASVHE